jgi:hypothetical protein
LRFPVPPILLHNHTAKKLNGGKKEGELHGLREYKDWICLLSEQQDNLRTAQYKKSRCLQFKGQQSVFTHISTFSREGRKAMTVMIRGSTKNSVEFSSITLQKSSAQQESTANSRQMATALEQRSFGSSTVSTAP